MMYLFSVCLLFTKSCVPTPFALLNLLTVSYLFPIFSLLHFLYHLLQFYAYVNHFLNICCLIFGSESVYSY